MQGVRLNVRFVQPPWVGVGRLKEADGDLEGTKAFHAPGASLFQRQVLTKVIDFNENSSNGTIWESLGSIKIWFYCDLLAEVCALESFPLE